MSDFTSLLPVESAVSSAASTEIQTFSSSAIQQAVSMMAQDAQVFMLGMEQVYVAANGKALAMIAKQDPLEQAAGTALLAQIAVSQTQTITFMTGAATVATAFSKL
ncbi:hypothetical protein [Segnochrobactrum spirostomi]|uniref:Uncharacterized protein n=1 Tax=Segnochrobactrum spirostomi TaxID=2608987 RepID=A0A6A7Y1W2_9HYPH|nr:hypothetical protein [Segnochrobactrum spirostomi]MQT12367.1 hypothetical protein [Segnochrobactrum spirostomi]